MNIYINTYIQNYAYTFNNVCIFVFAFTISNIKICHRIFVSSHF